MLDRLAERPELDLTVLYAGDSVQRRTWTIEPRHRARLPRRRARPGLYRALRHDYPLSLGVFRALAGGPPGGRRRLRVEHVRVAGGRALVPAAPGAVRAPRREQRAGRAPGLAPRGQGGRRPADRARRRPRCSSSAAGARGDDRARRRRRSGSRSSPTRSTSTRSARARDRLAARRDELRAEVGPRARTTSRCSPSPGSRPRRGSTRSSAPSRRRRSAARPRSSRATGPSASGSTRLARELGVRLVLLPGRPVGAHRRAVVARRRLRAPLATRAVGRRRQRGGGVRAARSCSPTASAPPSTCSRTAGTAALVPADDHAAAAEAIRASPPIPRSAASCGPARRAS